jgi:hypothetical protein
MTRQPCQADSLFVGQLLGRSSNRTVEVILARVVPPQRRRPLPSLYTWQKWHILLVILRCTETSVVGDFDY